MKSINEYLNKRDFSKTKEPKTSYKKNNSNLFVVQLHDATHLHYDFRLEYEGVLLSWAIPKGPSFNTQDKRLAVKVENHPIDYSDFEGIIPKGEYGGGTVMVWDKGVFVRKNDFKQGLKNGSLKFELFGERLKGNWTLVRLKNNTRQDNWLLIKELDEYCKKSSGISKYNKSVKSGRTLLEISKKNIVKNPFDKVNVQLAKLTSKIPDGKKWLFEIKYDGYRIISFIENGKAIMRTRNNLDYSLKLSNLCTCLENFSGGRSMVLDGEVVVIDKDGRTNFQYLQNSIKERSYPLSYIVFDILALDGKDLRNLTLIKRKKILKEIFSSNKNSNIVYSEGVEGNGEKCFEFAKENNLEGIMAKNLNSTYNGERNDDWLKIKCYHEQELVIGGFTRSAKKIAGFSSLLLGVYKNKKLEYIGRVGTGFNQSIMEDLLLRLNKLMTKKNPFCNRIETKVNESLFFVKPLLVAQVQYAEITEDYVLRQASFKGLRMDKKANEVSLENEAHNNFNNKIFINDIEISNPEKIVYKQPKITKLQIAEYYKKVSDRMLEISKNRILSVVRCHEGINSKCFFKKHPVGVSKGVGVIKLDSTETENKDYFYITNPQGIISEVQQGTIEFHLWGSKINSLEKPDMMVFDLDPDKNMDLSVVRQGVKDLKKILDKLKLKSFLKTSGGKGYHIVVPFTPKVDWDKFYDFSKKISTILEEKYPNKYTTNMRKSNRKNKIFIDWIRNGRGATSVAPYSLRARKGASISCPIFWKELDSIAPNQITILNIFDRKGNPWKNFNNVNQHLN